MLISERHESEKYSNPFNELPKKTVKNIQESLDKAIDFTCGDFWKEIKEHQ